MTHEAYLWYLAPRDLESCSLVVFSQDQCVSAVPAVTLLCITHSNNTKICSMACGLREGSRRPFRIWWRPLGSWLRQAFKCRLCEPDLYRCDILRISQIQRHGSHAPTHFSAFRHATQFVNLADRELTRPALRPCSRALVEAHFSPLSIIPMSAVAFTAMCVRLDRSACAHLHCPAPHLFSCSAQNSPGLLTCACGRARAARTLGLFPWI